MSIAQIAPRNRGVLRLHGWLLVVWAASAGFATSALLLHAGAIHSLALRYSVGAGAVYFVGFVFGGWWYARWWNARPSLTAETPRHASTSEVLAYQQSEEAVQKKFGWFNWLGDIGASGGDDPLSALLAILMLLGLAALALLFLGYFPIIATDAFASFLAEVVLEFVIGGVVARRALQPQSIDKYWSFMVGKTWIAGLLLMAVCGAVGYAIHELNPNALTIFQVFR
jgi:hypothetical protein